MSWLPVPEKYVGKRLRWVVFLTALIEMPWCGMYRKKCKYSTHNDSKNQTNFYNFCCYFGWAPIQYVMKNEDYFIQDCRAAQNATQNATMVSRSVGGAPLDSNDKCTLEQDQIFNWLYSVYSCRNVNGWAQQFSLK